jgi:hypothetical protein
VGECGLEAAGNGQVWPLKILSAVEGRDQDRSAMIGGHDTYWLRSTAIQTD